MAYGAIIGQTPTVQASAEMTSYNNDNTSSVITADNVQGAIDQLFTSVSNGKSQIASAITGMGVSTSANDSFAQMATNIGNIETGYDTSQVTATANTVRSGYKFVNSSGRLITGTIPSKGAQTYTPRTVSQTIAKGQYLSGNQTIQGDGNLIASNIKSGVSIFGVSGSYTGEATIGYITSIEQQTSDRIIFNTNITLRDNIVGSVQLYDPYPNDRSYLILFNPFDYTDIHTADTFGLVALFPPEDYNNIVGYPIYTKDVSIHDTYFIVSFSRLNDIGVLFNDIKLASISESFLGNNNGRVIATYD